MTVALAPPPAGVPLTPPGEVRGQLFVPAEEAWKLLAVDVQEGRHALRVPAMLRRSGMYLATNTNKRGLTLDLSSPEGRELFFGLVTRSDILVENFSPRVFDNFAITWEAVSEQNPRIVMVRMPAFGLDGPWRNNVGFAQTMEQMTGMAWLTGHEYDQPAPANSNCPVGYSIDLAVTRIT